MCAAIYPVHCRALRAAAVSPLYLRIRKAANGGRPDGVVRMKLLRDSRPHTWISTRIDT